MAASQAPSGVKTAGVPVGKVYRILVSHISGFHLARGDNRARRKEGTCIRGR